MYGNSFEDPATPRNVALAHLFSLWNRLCTPLVHVFMPFPSWLAHCQESFAQQLALLSAPHKWWRTVTLRDSRIHLGLLCLLHRLWRVFSGNECRGLNQGVHHHWGVLSRLGVDPLVESWARLLLDFWEGWLLVVVGTLFLNLFLDVEDVSNSFLSKVRILGFCSMSLLGLSQV